MHFSLGNMRKALLKCKNLHQFMIHNPHFTIWIWLAQKSWTVCWCVWWANEHQINWDVFIQNVEVTGKCYMLCVDVSKSMDLGSVHSSSQLAPAVAAISMAMVIARTEPHYCMMAFSSNGLTPVDVTSDMTIEQVCQTFSKVCMIPFSCVLWFC